MKEKVRDIDLKILSELMINARMSDRSLSTKLGVSQPTVSRIRARLEKEGYIREYSAVPDLSKLGYELLALTFVKIKSVTDEKIELAKKVAEESLVKGPHNVVMFERGSGLAYEGMLASYHENYQSYMELVKYLRQIEFLEIDRIDSYIVSLNDPVRYRPLTYKTLAKHILTRKKIE